MKWDTLYIVDLKFQVEGTNDTLIMWVVGSAAEYVDKLGDKEILEQAGKLLRFINSYFHRTFYIF